jgi:polysaccharide pyruvyl transferase WcaK-like protein
MNAAPDRLNSFTGADRVPRSAAVSMLTIRSGMRFRQSTIFLFGLFGVGNQGNDGSLEAMIAFLRGARPDVQLFCICPRPDLVGAEFGVATLPIRFSGYLNGLAGRLNRLLLKVPGRLVDLVETFNTVRKAGTMIIPGTGILDDFGERPFGMPLDILKWCLAARLAGTRIAFVSIGAGPIRHPLSRWLMISAAKLATYRSYRDDMSRKFMESAGLDTQGDDVYPDIAFRLRAPDVPASAALESTRLRVGVGVMSYHGWRAFGNDGGSIFETYVDKLARFVVHTLDGGHRVKLLMGETSDLCAVEALTTKVRAMRPGLRESDIVFEPSDSLHDLMRQMSETDVVVATRFHNIVCALKMGKPAISLGYSKKNDALMSEMGLGEFCQHVESFDVNTLIEQFSRLVSGKEGYRKMIRVRVREFNERLERQENFLLSTLI